MVREHAYTVRFYGEVVQAESYEKALRVAAGHDAPTSGSPLAPLPARDRTRSSAHGRRARIPTDVRWVRDDRGVARALPEPPIGPPVAPSKMQAPPAPEEEAEPSGPETD